MRFENLFSLYMKSCIVRCFLRALTPFAPFSVSLSLPVLCFSLPRTIPFLFLSRRATVRRNAPMQFLMASSSSLLSPHLTPSLVPPLSSGSTGQLRRFAVEPVSVFHSFWKGNFYKSLCWSCTGFLRRCKNWDAGFSSLESEILEFMQSTDKPDLFPTKEELITAGRLDLVNAIVKEGGWLAYGWDLDDHSIEICGYEDTNAGGIEGNATPSSGVSSSQPDNSVEIEAGESGIEGILNRLEKQRSSFLGVDFREREDSTSSKNDEDKEEWDQRTTTNAITAGLDNSSRVSSLSPTSSHLSGPQIKHDQHKSQFGTENLRNSLKPEMWRSWIIQRTGFQNTDFEDAEIVPSQSEKRGMNDDASGQPAELINRETELYSVDGNANHNDIKSRIQSLESELSSILHLLRSSSDKITMQMVSVQTSSSDDLAKFSDACEFQENEIMHAQDRLRSIRAKLSVLEGKMALAIRDAHKVVEEKQKKINNAQNALQILKTTSIVWPNNASEVLLTGSFDGWSSKMKFIVDGEWKIDPLRLVVTNNGHENNLLIIHDD
ncbi:hypothetical protein VNO78_09160 [Psophocarpus tetragonolobus]|uniref:AMP-activated protein kinase glycogen-binding domain-containing protein n=1 Tax=Psophocarpus tetragonolobus TaxID=3891 RepID=A0AAN9XU86_PSOTE